MIVQVTRKKWEDKIRKHGPAYEHLLRPAIIKSNLHCLFFNTSHPTYKAAKIKYSDGKQRVELFRRKEICIHQCADHNCEMFRAWKIAKCKAKAKVFEFDCPKGLFGASLLEKT